jgi:hypothetical protein
MPFAVAPRAAVAAAMPWGGMSMTTAVHDESQQDASERDNESQQHPAGCLPRARRTAIEVGKVKVIVYTLNLLAAIIALTTVPPWLFQRLVDLITWLLHLWGR